jgi:hypothetical protein
MRCRSSRSGAPSQSCTSTISSARERKKPDHVRWAGQAQLTTHPSRVDIVSAPIEIPCPYCTKPLREGTHKCLYCNTRIPRTAFWNYDSTDEIHEVMIDSLERYAGKLVVRKIAQSEAIAFEHLKHPRPKYRYAALSLIYIKWGFTQEIADMCEDMALLDPDAYVRGLAASKLATYYMKTGNMRIGNLLAQIVYNEKEESTVRESAYRDLFWLPEELPSKRPAVFGFRFPADVDWAFVDCFVRNCGLLRRIRRAFSWRKFFG